MASKSVAALPPPLLGVALQYALQSVTSLLPLIACYHAAALLAGDWWLRLVQWWRPWSDEALFGVSTFLVHEGMYLGTPWSSQLVA